MSTHKTLTEIEIEIGLRTALRASPRRRAAAEILYLIRPAKRLSRRDIMTKTLGLRDRYSVKTLDRALMDLAESGFLALQESHTAEEHRSFVVIG